MKGKGDKTVKETVKYNCKENQESTNLLLLLLLFHQETFLHEQHKTRLHHQQHDGHDFDVLFVHGQFRDQHHRRLKQNEQHFTKQKMGLVPFLFGKSAHFFFRWNGHHCSGRFQ